MAVFDDLWVRSLPGEQEIRPGSRQVLGQCYSRVMPTPVARPQMLAWSGEAAKLLDFEPDPVWTEVLGGNRVPPEMQPYSACYGGHQFGHWAGQLGDGRAITLTEVINVQQQRWEVQIKGAGPTPYSRRADGRAVLRSSIREFLCSEAMAHLGVPTTRALALVGTGDEVVRDMFYDGRPEPEPGAIVTRLSPSFVRFGNFEIFASRGEHEVLKLLTDFVIKQHFPHLGPPGPSTYRALFHEVCQSTALLMAHWMRLGFVHGVMNTDNMSILGLTIDYGPYGWLDSYEPTFTPNTTDRGLRYCYQQQPQIGQWNLARLAEALLPLVEDPGPLEESLDEYARTFQQSYLEHMWAKLGLPVCSDSLLEDLMRLVSQVETDMTLIFRNLAQIDELPTEGLPEPWTQAVYSEQVPASYVAEVRGWLQRYLERVSSDPTRAERMNMVNPSLIPRNYLVQQVIDQAEAGDHQAVERFLEELRHPYRHRDARDPVVQKRPEWARRAPGCSALSCSS